MTMIITVETLHGVKKVKLEEKNHIYDENWQKRFDEYSKNVMKPVIMTKEQEIAWLKRCNEIDG